MLTGACLCGAVRFQVAGPVLQLHNCHCSECRKAYGAAFGTVAVVEAKHFAYLSGADLIGAYKQSERVTRYWCKQCGSRLPIAEPWDPLVGIPAGLLEGDPGRRPDFHIFVGSKAPWWTITDKAPQYEAWKPGEDLNERAEDLKG
jgi:hypothetical protein